MNFKKIVVLALAGAMVLATLTGCATKSNDFDVSKEITVVSREDGSGTRGAFIELMGIEVKGDDGSKKDMTSDEAIIANKTDVMMTNIAGDAYSIGYVSLGSLSDAVKALNIDGVKPSADSIKDGTYKVSRPFNIATKGEPTGVAKDFINFILSKDGQDVVAKSYIAVGDKAEAFTSDKSTGKIVVAGSSSVSPIMEKLIEAYLAINTGAQIELQATDSTAGMTGAMDGTCDIGMASRALKDSEAQSLTGIEIAQDGIAVIVNNNNTITDISRDAVKEIFMGNITTWDKVSK